MGTNSKAYTKTVSAQNEYQDIQNMKSFILNIAVYTLEQKEKDLVMT